MVQWPRRHNFNDLVGSDKARFIFTNAAGDTVLDFVLDYLSASAGTPSGYRSLGATGGDGRMSTGNAAWILSSDTSLSRNLNDTGLCAAGDCSGEGTNLLVDSPPTVLPSDYTLPLGSPYGAWDFTNAYFMRIDAAAFGGSGFGGVSVGEVHNSPPKIGSNAVAPIVCGSSQPTACDLAGGGVTFKDRQLKWAVTNNGSTAVVVSQITVAWPETNGKLSKVKLNKDVLWDGKADWSAGGLTITSGDLTGDAKRKRIDPGKKKTLILEFEKSASSDLTQYSLTLSFGSGCEITMPNMPPPVTGNFCTTAPGTGRPKTLTMVYLDANGPADGSNCTTNCNQQDPSKVIVTGDPNNAQSVYIVATPTGKTNRLFEGEVWLDGEFTLIAADAGLATLDTNTTVNIYGSLGGSLLSSVQFHTSCSQPLNDGDYFGSLQLTGFSR